VIFLHPERSEGSLSLPDRLPQDLLLHPVFLRGCDFFGFAKKAVLKAKRLYTKKSRNFKKVTTSERSATTTMSRYKLKGAESKDPENISFSNTASGNSPKKYL
jgi:hypothetical protein